MELVLPLFRDLWKILKYSNCIVASDEIQADIQDSNKGFCRPAANIEDIPYSINLKTNLLDEILDNQAKRCLRQGFQ